MAENKAIRKASSCSGTIYTQEEEEDEEEEGGKKTLKSPESSTARGEKSSSVAAFRFHRPPFISSRMLRGQALKRAHVPLALAYCSEIYTKNVHT